MEELNDMQGNKVYTQNDHQNLFKLNAANRLAVRRQIIDHWF